jgi:hypothetical protein
VHDGRVDVICCTSAIAAALDVAPSADAPETITLSEQVRLTRTGRAMRLVQGGGHVTGTTPDQSLTKLLVHARRWWGELKQGEIDIKRLPEREKISAAYISRVVRLAFLAPDVVEAILAGKQRAGVTAKALTLDARIEASWEQQVATMLLHASASNGR